MKSLPRNDPDLRLVSTDSLIEELFRRTDRGLLLMNTSPVGPELSRVSLKGDGFEDGEVMAAVLLRYFRIAKVAQGEANGCQG